MTVLKTIKEKTCLLLIGNHCPDESKIAFGITDDYSTLAVDKCHDIETDGFVSILNKDDFKEGLKLMSDYYYKERDTILSEDLEDVGCLFVEVEKGDVTINMYDYTTQKYTNLKIDLSIPYIFDSESCRTYRNEKKDAWLEPVIKFPEGSKFKNVTLDDKGYELICNLFDKGCL